MDVVSDRDDAALQAQASSTVRNDLANMAKLWCGSNFNLCACEKRRQLPGMRTDKWQLLAHKINSSREIIKKGCITRGTTGFLNLQDLVTTSSPTVDIRLIDIWITTRHHVPATSSVGTVSPSTPDSTPVSASVVASPSSPTSIEPWYIGSLRHNLPSQHHLSTRSVRSY